MQIFCMLLISLIYVVLLQFMKTEIKTREWRSYSILSIPHLDSNNDLETVIQPQLIPAVAAGREHARVQLLEL